MGPSFRILARSMFPEDLHTPSHRRTNSDSTFESSYDNEILEVVLDRLVITGRQRRTNHLEYNIISNVVVLIDKYCIYLSLVPRLETIINKSYLHKAFSQVHES